jgi:hypothetical protein
VRKVIDSNQLQAPQLREYLGKSLKNFAVLPDFVAMEAYKGDSLKSIFKSMSVLADYPRQAIVLKGTAKIFSLHGRVKGLQRRLIDEVQTNEFSEFVHGLRLAENGNTRVQKQILDHGARASEHLDKMLNEAPGISVAIQEVVRRFTKEDLARIRSNNWFEPTLSQQIITTTTRLAVEVYNASPLTLRGAILKTNEFQNTFVFRVTLAFFIMALRKVADGGLNGLRPEKFRNDFVDMILVAYGTYFDGLMSADKNVNFMFTLTCELLFAFFEAEIPSISQHARGTNKAISSSPKSLPIQ